MENSAINTNLGIRTLNNYEASKTSDYLTNSISKNRVEDKDLGLLNSLDALALMNRPLVIKRYAV